MPPNGFSVMIGRVKQKQFEVFLISGYEPQVLPIELNLISTILKNCLVLRLRCTGSVNWSKPSVRGRKATVFGNYRDLYEKYGRVLLIPPTWRKIFDEQLVHIWEGAVEALNNATRIIVVGFSMPPTDSHFKYLIAAGLQRNISLRKFLFVNPGLAESKRIERAKLRKNLFSILRHELEGRGVVEPIPITAKEFFFHRKHLSRVGREIQDDFLSIDYLFDEFETNYRSELKLQ
jgi:hypothetical protein